MYRSLSFIIFFFYLLFLFPFFFFFFQHIPIQVMIYSLKVLKI